MLDSFDLPAFDIVDDLSSGFSPEYPLYWFRYGPVDVSLDRLVVQEMPAGRTQSVLHESDILPSRYQHSLSQLYMAQHGHVDSPVAADWLHRCPQCDLPVQHSGGWRQHAFVGALSDQGSSSGVVGRDRVCLLAVPHVALQSSQHDLYRVGAPLCAIPLQNHPGGAQAQVCVAGGAVLRSDGACPLDAPDVHFCDAARLPGVQRVI